jgi:hypothetical protein
MQFHEGEFMSKKQRTQLANEIFIAAKKYLPWYTASDITQMVLAALDKG